MLNINYIYFDNMVSQIFPPELQLNKADSKVSFLDLHLSISDYIVSTKLYDKPGRVAQSVTCLATDARLTADPGVASSIPARYHTFVEIDHEIISTAILLPFR